MRVRKVSVLLLLVVVVLGFSSGCLSAPTPTVVPLPTAPPSPVITLDIPMELLPTPTTHRLAPADVPACKGAQALEQPIPFTWAGIEDVVSSTPETNWTFYRCEQGQTSLSAAYRERMVRPPYNWIETYWEERPQATMGVYYGNSGSSSVPNRWLYLWFLPDNSTEQGSALVAAWWNIPKSC